MNTNTEQLKLIIIFATVLKHGSMNAAAPHLGMTASAISQHIKNLEKFYQIKLLNRTTRKLIPTEAGQQLWQYAQKIDELLNETDHAMQSLRDEPVGEVKLTMPTGFAQTAPIRSAIVQIREKYPNIRLILIENSKVDDLWQADAPDIAIRATLELDDENLIARPLAIWQTLICASPDYLANYPIEKPQDLLKTHWLNYNHKVLLSAFNHLNLPQTLPENRIDCDNNSNTAREFAQLGLGVGIWLSGDVASGLADGSLVAVLPNSPLPNRTIYAVTVNRTQSAKIQAVLGVLAQSFQAA